MHFLQPWLVIAAAAIAVASGALAWRTRRAAPMMFALAAASFFLAGARPQLGSKPEDVRHALVIDVSGSMEARKLDADALAAIDLPPGHSFVRFELSDALRARGGAHGQGTDYARLADVAADKQINGEIVLVTDGQGPLDALYEAVNPHRLILLRAPAPDSPDAAVVAVTAPTSAAPGSNVGLTATIYCDRAADVPWRLLEGSTVIASGTRRVPAGLATPVDCACAMPEGGLVRLRFVLSLPEDRESRNDEASVSVLVGGKRRIDYCNDFSAPDGGDALLALLRSDPSNDVRVRDDLPLTRAELAATDVVFINNLSLGSTHRAREELKELADWASSGGRLFMAGTDGAFGPGGYRGTAIEGVMPVRFRPEDAPPHKTLLLLDVSASMNDPLAGGGTKLARLREAADRVLDSLGEADSAAVVGFRSGLVGDVVFRAPESSELRNEVDALTADGSTHIATTLRQAISLFSDADDGARILLISDGQDVEKAGQAAFEDLATDLRSKKIQLDIVLTDAGEIDWVNWMLSKPPESSVRLWATGDGFEGLLDLLDRTLAGGDAEWIVTEDSMVPGAATPLPRFVRCAPRRDASVTTALSTTYEQRSYPLLAWRQLVGRTGCLCTDSWGGSRMAEFWGDDRFQSELSRAVEFVLAGAGSVRLVLNPLPEGAELVWTGAAEAPANDLRLEPRGTARLDAPGRWLLDWPAGDELRVFDGEQLLQRIPLPKLVPPELRATGDDEVFFSTAEEGGIRVFSSLAAWKPRRVVESGEEPTDVTWLPALLAMLLLLTGFALRRR
ncbi:MAG: VWA domain-containing protein [Planctomycetes bacterium]|nr:VWA domain-containing protein [Planctomycetota bacterium]